MASDLRIQEGITLPKLTGGTGFQNTYQGNTQYLDSDLTIVGLKLEDIDEDLGYNFNDSSGFKTYRLKKAFINSVNRPAGLVITAANLNTYFEDRGSGSGGGTGTLTQNQEKQWGFRGGNNDTGDIIGTEDVLLVPTTITNAVLVIYSGTFPATTTILKVKSSTVDYITVSVPGNQGAGVIACTITTALINAVPLSPISAILNLSQACPGVDYIIYTTTNS